MNKFDETKSNVVGTDASARLEKNQNRNNIRILDKHKSDVVGADASVHLEKNQNKNYIKTFDKHKLNVVGVGVPDDPNAKNKYTNKVMSNNQTSNIKIPTSNTAITLIALIITIIVLLILAGVTLSMVMGESGLFGKANKAKEQTQISTAEETIKLAVLENSTKEAAGETALNNTELKADIANKLKELGYTVSEDNNVVTYYEDKTINIEDYLKIEKPKTTGITSSDIKNHPDWYYGKEVDYTSENRQNDWKIFHSDGTNIYLITGNYVKVTDNEGNIDTSKLNPDTKIQIADSTANYRVNWNSSNLPGFSADVSNDIFSKFKINTSVFDINSHKSNPNAQCTSTLLNPSYWAEYIDSSKGDNQYAIGGPTVELWMESWNARYTNEEDQLYCDSSNENGYFVRKNTDSVTTSIELNLNKDNGGELYFGNNYSALTDGDSTGDFYWIATSSAQANYNLIDVNYGGGVSYYNYDSNCGGLRPVVCLTSNISSK